MQAAGDPSRLQASGAWSGAVVPTRADIFARVLRAEVTVGLVREQDGLQEFDLLGFGRVDEVVELFQSVERRDDLERVALAMRGEERRVSMASGRGETLRQLTRRGSPGASRSSTFPAY